jgi:hypothetical protein
MSITERATVAVFGVLLVSVFELLAWMVMAVAIRTESVDPTQRNTLISIQDQPTHDLGWDRTVQAFARERQVGADRLTSRHSPPHLRWQSPQPASQSTRVSCVLVRQSCI